jgi:prevent-host-death family protein
MGNRVVSATEFKAKCLGLLNEIDQHGGTITITKRGRPMVTVGRAKKERWKSSEGVLAGKGRIIGDIANEDLSHIWNVVNGNDF